MCGIVGYYSVNGYKEDLNTKLPLLKHRGPDGSNVWESAVGSHTIGLGHSRLSIIDLSSRANQPFISDDGKYVMVFNGEIYNYKELRKLLPEEKFKTTSDTEVLLKLFIVYGAQMLNMLEGMFALAIYNQGNDSLFIARDHLGIKPLYYFLDNNQIIFSSEIKILWSFSEVKKEVDQSVFVEFFLNGFLYEPDTGFKNVKKLESGCYLEITRGENIFVQKTKYWSPFRAKCNEKISNVELLKQIERSIEYHLESDVPVGLFYSGGVDSSIILNYLRNRIEPIIVKPKDKAFEQAGFADDYHYAKEISKIFGCKLNSIELDANIKSNEDFLNALNFLSIHSEELLADFTFLPSQYISRYSREVGFKVMLSGMGADEIFGGYPRYKLIKYERFYKLLNFVPTFILNSKSFSKKLERFRNFFEAKSFIMKYTSTIGYFSLDEIQKLFIDPSTTTIYITKLEQILKLYPANISNFKKAILLDLHGFLSHNFLVADKSSMLESVELRVPLATKSLMELAMNLDDEKLLSFFDTKVLLKKLLIKFLPKKLIYRKKTGFNPPLDGYINALGKGKILETLEENGLFNIIKREPVILLMKSHFDIRQKNHTYKIYQLLYFSFWLKNNTQ